MQHILILYIESYLSFKIDRNYLLKI